MTATLNYAEEMEEQFGTPEFVQLERYPNNEAAQRGLGEPVPDKMHGAMIGLCCAALEAEGYTTRIGWIPEES